MDRFTRQDLDRLCQSVPSPCVSIYLPTHTAGPEIRQDPIRLRNLLTQAERELAFLGYDLRRDHLLDPLRALVDDHRWWRYQDHGLALFAAPGFSAHWRTPMNFSELVTIGSRFHLKPLLPYLDGNGTFFLLLLSENSSRLFQADRYGLVERLDAELPRGLADVSGIPDHQRGRHQHSTGSASHGRGAVAFHGRGGEKDGERTERERFLRAVDHRLVRFLHLQFASRPPLVLACIGSHRAMYGEINTYENLADGFVEGNHECTGAHELHGMAWPLVADRFLNEEHRARQAFARCEGTGLTSTNVAEVVVAARQGRVAHLFLAGDQHFWGDSPRGDELATVLPSYRPGAEDLLDTAAVESLRHRADVHVVPLDSMPHGNPIAAVFRY